MAAWGYTDEHDGTGGEQPRGTVVSNNVCHELGVFQLQSSCWFEAKTAGTTIANNLFYNGTSLSGPISTILTVLSWICAGICMCGALPSHVCA